MARSMTTTKAVNAVEETKVNVSENIETEPIKAPEKKKFKDTDTINCVSIVAGELGMIGIKSGINYKWAGRGDETDVEYQDLAAAVRSSKKHIFEPFFIVQDKDFLAQFPQVEKLYASMFSINDLKEVLRLQPAQMKETILSLPSGAQESIKSIAATEISKGTLDSVKKIKILDEIFNTKLMLMTELFN